MRPPPAPPLGPWTCADCNQPESKCGTRRVRYGDRYQGTVVYDAAARTDEGPICHVCSERRRMSQPKLKNLPPLENCLLCALDLSDSRQSRLDGPYGTRTSCISCYTRRELKLPPLPPLDAWFCTNCGCNYDENSRKPKDGPDGRSTICNACYVAWGHGPKNFEARRNKQREVTPEMHLALQNAIHEREFKLARLRADYSASSQEDADAALALADAEAADNERLARFRLDEDVARLRAAKASETKKQGEGSDLEGAAEPQTEIDHPHLINMVDQLRMLKQIADSDVAKLPKAIIRGLDFRDPKSSLFDEWACPICLDSDCKEPQRIFVEGLLIPICEECASAAAR